MLKENVWVGKKFQDSIKPVFSDVILTLHHMHAGATPEPIIAVPEMFTRRDTRANSQSTFLLFLVTNKRSYNMYEYIKNHSIREEVDTEEDDCVPEDQDETGSED